MNKNRSIDEARTKEVFCERLKELRIFKQLTQAEVANKLSCSVSTYANWEQGRTEPSIYDIYKLLLCFEIEANELFDINSLAKKNIII